MKKQTIFKLFAAALCLAMLATGVGCSAKKPKDQAVSVVKDQIKHPVYQEAVVVSQAESSYGAEIYANQPRHHREPEQTVEVERNISIYNYYEGQTAQATQETQSTKEPEETVYEGVLDMYQSSVDCNWENQDGENAQAVTDPDNATFLFAHYYADATLWEIGYAFLDLNQDGQAELLVGHVDHAAENGLIYQLYTIYNGRIVSLIQPTERDSYYVTTDCTIYNEGSGGAMLNGRMDLYLEDGELKIRSGVLYDGYEDEANPYYSLNNNYLDYDNQEAGKTPITEQEANTILNHMPDRASLTLTPFAQYE
ncbi:MAG: hypothetical protein IKU10_02000 [Clostridia bacterium]|nr:hypothetical protein [Clostridia bacterium]